MKHTSKLEGLKHILGTCTCDRLNMNCWYMRNNDPEYIEYLPGKQEAQILAWHKAEVERLLDKYDCQVAHCHDGHFPVQTSEDGDVDWVGCDNCTSGKVRLEPYATIAELRASLEVE